MSESLFRKEALEERAAATAPQPNIATLPSSRAAAMVAMGFVSGFILLGLFGEFSRKETVQGVIEPEGGVVTLSAPQRGRITNLEVSVGDQVSAGDVLFAVDDSRLSGNTAIDQQQLATLEDQIQQLSALLSGVASEQQSEQARIESELSALDFQLDAINRSVAMNVQQVRLARKRHETRKKLVNQGHLPAHDLIESEETLLAVEQAGEQLKLEAGELRLQMKQLDFQLESLPRRMAEKASKFRQQLSSLRNEREELNVRSLRSVTAPVDAIVAALEVPDNHEVDAGRRVLTLVPKDQPLRARLLVPSAAAGFVQRGLEVRLNLDAFPHQRFGSLSATIEDLSQVAVPLQVDAPQSNFVFPTYAAIEQPFVEAYGERFPIQPGMTFTADIVAERQSLWRWLFDPVFAAGGRL